MNLYLMSHGGPALPYVLRKLYGAHFLTNDNDYYRTSVYFGIAAGSSITNKKRGKEGIVATSEGIQTSSGPLIKYSDIIRIQVIDDPYYGWRLQIK